MLEPSPLRDYLRAEESFTRLTVLDTVEDLINETSTVLHRKAQRPAWALLILTAAASIFAMGIVVKAIWRTSCPIRRRTSDRTYHLPRRDSPTSV